VTQPVVRAAEIGMFAYCERAWGYAQRGEISSNTGQMSVGSARHRAHAAASTSARIMRIAGLLLLFTGLALAASQLL
jgi:hypothetical protein